MTAQETLEENFIAQYKQLTEEAYNLFFTDTSLSDILSYEASLLYQKITFLQLN